MVPQIPIDSGHGFRSKVIAISEPKPPTKWHGVGNVGLFVGNFKLEYETIHSMLPNVQSSGKKMNLAFDRNDY